MHNSVSQKTRFSISVILLLFLSQTSYAHEGSHGKYEPVGNGIRLLESESGTVIRMLIEKSNLGSREIEIGEIILPPGTESIGHSHGSIKFFYVISGELEHIVKGKSYLLKPGMIGTVKPGDEVVHKVPGKDPVRALIIWTPGGESDRLGNGFKERQIN